MAKKYYYKNLFAGVGNDDYADDFLNNARMMVDEWEGYYQILLTNMRKKINPGNYINDVRHAPILL